ncbi:MAG: hypothetical protein QOI56_405, partial [Actinomycetota bacterium]|nr:hypothetical protein [Actinomycetota bacterium]
MGATGETGPDDILVDNGARKLTLDELG